MSELLGKFFRNFLMIANFVVYNMLNLQISNYKIVLK